MSAKVRVIVVGGGAIGLASAWALSRRGAAVTVLERFGHVHDRGSHSGHTRVIRQAYHEGSSYVPMIQQSDREWQALGRRAGDELLVRSGLLLFGPADDPELRAAIDTCNRCQLPYSLHEGAEARERWPVVSQIVHWVVQDDLASQERYLRENLDAMAHRVGELQAQLVALQVMGERVAAMAGIAPGELQPESPPAPPDNNPVPSSRGQDDLFALIERLADLRAKGILSDEEFAAKKTELLSRL